MASATWSVHGEDQQVLHVPMDGGSELKCEVGCMMYASEHAQMRVVLLGRGFFGAMSASMSGESLFCQDWKIQGGANGYVGVTNNLPGKMLPVGPELLSQGFTCKRHSWVCNIGSVDVSVKILSNASCMGRCCGGMALLVQGLRSSDPNAFAFIQGCGTIMQRELQAGEVIVADSDAVLAFSDTVGVDVKTAGNCFTMCCGGEGMFNTVLTGPGMVYLQSMPIEKLRRLFPQKKKKDKKDKNPGE
jgi:uncharacterized protein (AIM24 family)